ncbi:hypothetical protein ABT150_35605 [Streptomyces mirabilis]|uniref:hypothetical protein n=1 Tax=Streptomyces mirabilis TaxID=68239 RepID=UPI0033314904
MTAVDEITATELTVEGYLPPELTGRLIRNSHNPKPGVTPTHWFRAAAWSTASGCARAAPSGTATAGCAPPPWTALPA